MKKQMRMAKNRMPPILSSIKAESEPFFIGSTSEGEGGLFRLRGRHHSFPFHSKNMFGCRASFLKHILGLWYMRFIRIKNLLGIPSPFGCQANAPPPQTLKTRSPFNTPSCMKNLLSIITIIIITRSVAGFILIHFDIFRSKHFTSLGSTFRNKKRKKTEKYH